MSCVLGAVSQIHFSELFGREECEDADAVGNPFSGFGRQWRIWLWQEISTGGVGSDAYPNPECELCLLCPGVVAALKFSLEYSHNVVCVFSD